MYGQLDPNQGCSNFRYCCHLDPFPHPIDTTSVLVVRHLPIKTFVARQRYLLYCYSICYCVLFRMQLHGITMPLNDTYKYQLRVHKALIVCDDSLKSFILQDFCEESHCLKVKRGLIYCCIY